MKLNQNKQVDAIVIAGYSLGGGKDVYPGDRIALSEREFALKERLGFVRVATEDDVANADPEPENADPKPTKRGRK